MARPTDAEELRAAWRALSSSAAGGEGWRTIPIAAQMPVRIRAGRHFPDNSEALLVGFTSPHISPATKLPEGRGFSVSLMDLKEQPDTPCWVCLSRSASGSQDMFATMAADVLNAVSGTDHVSEATLFQMFIARIAAWQYFMEHGAGMLGQEVEVGLFGELLLLQDLLSAGIGIAEGVDAWRGPAGGVRDFELGSGGIEVKSSVSLLGMPVTISSLAQLDSSPEHPAFLIAVRLVLDATGSTLPELADSLSSRMLSEHAALQRFRSLLLRAGYVDLHADRYQRRFVRQEMRVLPVAEGFPRLTRASVPAEILDVKYELDLDRIIVQSVDLLGALHRLGVL